MGKFKVGDKVKAINIQNDFNDHVKAVDMNFVGLVDDINANGDIHVEWDNNHSGSRYYVNYTPTAENCLRHCYVLKGVTAYE